MGMGAAPSANRKSDMSSQATTVAQPPAASFAVSICVDSRNKLNDVKKKIKV